jgi:hypothetical protein
MPATAEATGKLEAVYPNKARYAGRELVIGALSCTLLAEVIARGGSVPLARLGPLVWGRDGVPRNTAEKLVSRLSQRLRVLGYPGRLGYDRGNIVLYA